MKRLLAIILAFIYLSTSVGATVHLHYCMGRLFSWSLINHDNKTCTFCGMPKDSTGGHCMAVKSGCCKDEHKRVVVDKDQKTPELAFQFLKFPFAIPAVNPDTFLDIHVSSFIVEYPSANAPPGATVSVPVFIRNCNFRI